jgi:XTP/dITP diphosphohydrolase
MRLRTGDLVRVATTNTGKLQEMRELLAVHGLRVESMDGLGYLAPPEVAPDFEGNARIKALAAAALCRDVVMADDSGLCIDMLDGWPGVSTADLMAFHGGRDAFVGMERLRAAVLSRGGVFPVAARFRAAVVVAGADLGSAVGCGEVSGHLVWPPRGSRGHGFDPMFAPLGCPQTYGEMAGTRKAATSHRALAVAAVIRKCFT